MSLLKRTRNSGGGAPPQDRFTAFRPTLVDRSTLAKRAPNG